MKTLVISKPVYDFILPLVEFPQDGDKFFIDKSINSLSNIGSLVAITFAKYGRDVSFTGMIGEDYIGNKIKEILEEYKIDTKYIETSYTEKTCTSYKIYNSKNNKFTTIEENSLKNNLTKYKYEFIPDVIVMDDRDYPANLASINNFPNSKKIFIGEKYTKNSSVYCNKCNFIISNLKFASDATGVSTDLSKTKNVIALFQKFIDLYSSNLIIKLDNFDILYCVDDEVRLIKNVNKNIVNKENIYYSVLSYFLSENIDVESSIKLTNKVMLLSNNELNMINNLPDIKVINDSLEEYKRTNENIANLNNDVHNELNVNNQTNVNHKEQPINNYQNSDVNNGVDDVERL